MKVRSHTNSLKPNLVARKPPGPSLPSLRTPSLAPSSVRTSGPPPSSVRTPSLAPSSVRTSGPPPSSVRTPSLAPSSVRTSGPPPSSVRTPSLASSSTTLTHICQTVSPEEPAACVQRSDAAGDAGPGWLPREMRKTIPVQDQRWMGNTLFHAGKVRPDFKLWYEPPVQPSSTTRFQHPIVFLPTGFWCGCPIISGKLGCSAKLVGSILRGLVFHHMLLLWLPLKHPEN
ncbi:protein IQ-DOMAIN 14-like [Girardinichthys multiradiatus]|uniref:protein IQ-DOMAIN 14-like n=1 Tax=Girardinichthys multiradiatus TaxID=208333 RepID=UPI001FAC4F3A|nr:protein IQ-DOMAIN 14-like [Girardinichthys multiradiatus]